MKKCRYITKLLVIILLFKLKPKTPHTNGEKFQTMVFTLAFSKLIILYLVNLCLNQPLADDFPIKN